ncbi:MAG: hypothetical protein P8P28_07025 [Polaribacter sp.]|jgi:hypothetical protein|nr:hypothetical protein [Polaribacter sp.]
MKKTVLLLLVFQSFLLNAQEPPKMLKYNAKNAANIFYYNIDEIPKKIKVKSEALKKITTKELRNYNSKIKNISFLNFQELRELEVLVNTIGEQSRTNPDLRRKLRKNIEMVILPIRDSVAKFEETINSAFKTVLSKKQYKKWIKYQKNVKRELLPKRPRNTSARPPSNGMGRGGRGRNRRF